MSVTLFLSGGGNASQTAALDHAFVQSIKREPRLLYLPFALNRDVQGFEAAYDWITTTLGAHTETFIDITMWLDVANKRYEDLASFDAIYIGGGNTYKLLAILTQSGFIEAIHRFLDDGKPVYGGSAGAIIFGKTIATVEEENDQNYRYSKGMGRLGTYSLRCHFTEDDTPALVSLAKQLGSPIIALPEHVGLIVRDTQIKCTTQGAVLFEPSGAYHPLSEVFWIESSL